MVIEDTVVAVVLLSLLFDSGPGGKQLENNIKKINIEIKKTLVLIKILLNNKINKKSNVYSYLSK